MVSHIAHHGRRGGKTKSNTRYEWHTLLYYVFAEFIDPTSTPYLSYDDHHSSIELNDENNQENHLHTTKT